MEWQSQGFILSKKTFGEHGLILEVMTRDQGRVKGVLRGGRSRRMQSLLQIGTLIEFTWRARLEEHLGSFTLEPLRCFAADILTHHQPLYALQTLVTHLRLLAEREQHKRLYDAGLILLENLNEKDRLYPLLIEFEMLLLDELGYGLDIEQCALSGREDNLRFVSPNTGRVVHYDLGKKYSDKVLKLPAFLRYHDENIQKDALYEGFALTSHFLDRHIWQPRAMGAPLARQCFIDTL